MNWPRKEVPFASNGSGPKAFPPTPDVTLSQRRNDDISEKGIDENVHWFANPNTETLNWPRKEVPFAENGSGPKAFPPAAMAQRLPKVLPGLEKRKGISEKGMDEDVHDFANNQPEVPRLSYPRSEAPMKYNGSGPKAFPPTANLPLAYAQRQRREPAPASNGWDGKKDDAPPAWNGSGPKAFPPTLAQQRDRVFSHNDGVIANNGSGAGAFPPVSDVPINAYSQGEPAPQQRKKKDISEKGIDEEVHGFANSMVEPLAWPRKQEPFAENGSGPKAFPPTPNTYAQGPVPQQRKKKDISEKGIDEEVHGFANSMVEPIAWPRK